MGLLEADIKKGAVAVALSGGVDSAVSALLLQQQGYDLFAVTLDLDGTGEVLKDASSVAQALGIPLRVLEAKALFQSSVIDPFIQSYLDGETPLPCAICNNILKFGALADWAKEQGAAALATGHYVRKIDGVHGVEMHKAMDPKKDQSYFLYGLSLEQLSFAMFPLGHKTKDDIRAIAMAHHLPVASKSDSQDICFLPDGDYAGFICAHAQGCVKEGAIVDSQGRVLGHHSGLPSFTIGQRKGLNIHDRQGEQNEPLYVVDLDVARNVVVVGAKESLARRRVLLRSVNWLGDDLPIDGINVMVKLRSTQDPQAAKVTLKRDLLSGSICGEIELVEPVFGVAPGQAGVFYDGSRLLGGGTIEKA